MEIPTFTATTLAKTKSIRIPISGPKPWNQLAFIQCVSLGKRYEGVAQLFRYRMRFSSEFKIENFKQAELKWHNEHTYISATQFAHRVYTNIAVNYIVAAEDIKGFVDPDGHIGFESQIAVVQSGADIVESVGTIGYRFSVSAYVLLYEPPKNPPPAVPPTKPGWMPKIEELPSQFRRRRDFIFTDDPSSLRK